MNKPQDDGIKAKALADGMRQIEREYRAEGRHALASRIEHARLQLASDSEAAARLYDAIRGADPTRPIRPQVEAKFDAKCIGCNERATHGRFCELCATETVQA